MEPNGLSLMQFQETEVERRTLAMTSLVDSNQISDWSGSPRNPISMATLDRFSSSNLSYFSSSSSSSPVSRLSRSCSSASVRDELSDQVNIDHAYQGFSDAWLNKEPDDDFNRLHPLSDSYYDLFPEYSLLNLTDVTCHETNGASSSLPGFSIFRNSPFDDSLIPTCVTELSWENESYPDFVFSIENGSNIGDLFPDKRQQMQSNHSSISGSSSIASLSPSHSSSSSNSSNSSSNSSSSEGRVMTTAPRQVNNDKNDDKIQRRRRPGRPRKTTTKGGSDESTSSDNDNNTNNNSTDNNNDPATHRSRRRRKQHPWKGHHLWEFIRELLENNDDPTRSDGSGEGLVRWENREKGVFLIVNSKEVADLWGKRKRNEKMTYEKLSRSLRWCRTSGFLAEVPKDRKYPKKLCFCFGHRAYDIHRTTATTPAVS